MNEECIIADTLRIVAKYQYPGKSPNYTRKPYEAP